MEEFQISRDNGASLVFNGELIAQVSNEQQALSLYRTEAGRFVCHRLDCVNKKSMAVVCDSNEAIIDFFKMDCLANDIYSKAGIDASKNDLRKTILTALNDLHRIESLFDAISLIIDQSVADRKNNAIYAIRTEGSNLCAKVYSLLDQSEMAVYRGE